MSENKAKKNQHKVVKRLPKVKIARDFCKDGDKLEIVTAETIAGISHKMVVGTKVQVHMLDGERILVDCPNDSFRNVKLHIKHTNAYKK